MAANPINQLWRRLRRRPPVRRLFYDLVGRVTMNQADWGLMNFGFAYPDGEAAPVLPPERRDERFALQMYHRVMDGQSGNESMGEVTGKTRVLEVGCGRGGGARYMLEAFAPHRLTAVDFAPALIKFCRSGESDERLEFVIGDAMNLDLPDQSFDRVINIESSHCYPDKLAFFAEVLRVLEPGGTFHYADDFPRDTWERRARQLKRMGFELLEVENVTPGVLRAMDADAPRRQEMVKRLAPWPMREVAANWAGLPGSEPYERFASGTNRYMRCIARKT